MVPIFPGTMVPMSGYAYRGDPPPPTFNMASYCLGAGPLRPAQRLGLVVAHTGDPTVEHLPDEEWTFGELDDAVRRIGAGLLSRGLRPGDRVLLRLGNTSDAPLVFFGAAAVGLVAVPTSALLTPDEVAVLVADCRPALVVASPELRDGLPESRPVVGPTELAVWRAEAAPAAYRQTSADDPAFLVYTSGTSGEPKGVLHGHRSAWGRRPMYAGWLGIGAGDVMLHAGALNWTYTLGVGLTDPWATGATAVVYNGPRDPAVWGRLIERRRATIFAAVPGVYRQLLAGGGLVGRDLSSLRHGLTAGEALRPDLYAAWQAATGLPLYEALGMSEISTYVSSGPAVPTRPGSPGKPQPGRSVAILPVDPAPDSEQADQPLPLGQTGLLAVHRSDPGLLLRYWDRPDEDAKARRGEWFVGGDLAHLDPDGYLVHHGRADDVMNAGGYRVSPQEVERVLAGHPAVHDVGVTEVQVRAGVTVIAAFVVPEQRGWTEADSQALLDYAAGRLAAYKVPRLVACVGELPRTANGKVRRRELAERGLPTPGTA